MSPDLGSAVLPRVLIVSRRTLRKNKFVDFVGEYHLDLIVRYGAVPVIVPRVTGIQSALNSYEPIHGVLLCEGEDIDPSLYKDDSLLSLEEMEEIKRVHGSDTTIDTEKDLIELTLIHLCIKRGIPFFGICRGSQILNIACGGTLYQDIGKEFSRKQNPSDHHHNQILVTHIDYNNYDSHRHPIRIEPDTPLHTWFKDSLPDNKMEIMVNSYHHQGVKTLANRFSSMAYSPDGLIEGFYDPDHYNPDQGKFCVGLQFHPERMRQYSYDDDDDDDQQFDYPGCGNAYREFVKAVIVFKRKVDVTTTTTSIINRPRWSFLKTRKMMEEEKQEVIINRSFDGKLGEIKQQQQQQEKEVEEMEELQTVRMLMDRLSSEQLGDLLGFYQSMERVCGELIMEKKKMRSSQI